MAVTFSIRRVQFWTLFYALLTGFLISHPCTTLSAIGATIVGTLFVIIDACVAENRRYRGMLALSYFACVMALAIGTSLTLSTIFPPQLPLGLFQLLKAFDENMKTAATYLIYGSGLTLFSVATALYYSGEGTRPRWLLAMNVPGIACIGYVIALAVLD